jgi:hypothetical protein
MCWVKCQWLYPLEVQNAQRTCSFCGLDPKPCRASHGGAVQRSFRSRRRLNACPFRGARLQSADFPGHRVLICCLGCSFAVCIKPLRPAAPTHAFQCHSQLYQLSLCSVIHRSTTTFPIPHEAGMNAEVTRSKSWTRRLDSTSRIQQFTRVSPDRRVLAERLAAWGRHTPVRQGFRRGL